MTPLSRRQDDEQLPLFAHADNGGSTHPLSSTVKSYDTISSSSSSSGGDQNENVPQNHDNHNEAEWESLITTTTTTTTAPSPKKEQEREEKLSNKATTRTTYLVSKGHILLLIVAILYGSLNVSLRGVYAFSDPPTASALSTIRGWMAVVCFVPFLLLPKGQAQTSQQSTTTNDNQQQLFQVALELAVWNFGAQGFINIGLQFIPSARAAFFTQLSVVMTPGLAACAGQKLHCNVGIACIFALVGLILLSSSKQQDDTDSSSGFTLGFGDVLVLLGALSWSTYIYRLSAVGSRFSDVHLQAVKNVLLALLYTLWCVGAFLATGQVPWAGWNDSGAMWPWACLFYSALGPGCIADVLQQQGQTTVSATVSNIILSLEPVFTALFGRLLLGEVTSGMEKLGGGMILVAAIVATMGQD